jgi:TetR/AcrR family transcriptional regulator, transcriptional repressor for nem operon
MPRTSDAKVRLLEAAIDLIWRQSYGSVSVDDICQAAGVKKGSFYHFFKSKTELVRAAIEHHWDVELRPAMDDIFRPTRPARERFETLFAYVFEKQVKYQARFGRVLGCPLVSIGSETSGSDPEICQTAAGVMDRIGRYWLSAGRDLLIELGRDPKTAEALIGQLSAYVNGKIAEARIRNDPQPLRSLAEEGMKILGIMPEKSDAA